MDNEQKEKNTPEVMPDAQAAPAGASSEVGPNEAAWMEAMQKKYPDTNRDDLFKASTDGYNTEHEYAKSSREQLANLHAAIESSPEVAAFLAQIYEYGADNHPERAFRVLNDTLKAYMNGEIDDDEYIRETERRAKEESDAKSAKDAAIAKQTEEIVAFCQENGIDEDEFRDQLKVFFERMGKHAMTRDDFKRLHNMVNYDSDIEDAKEAGRVAGRNESIRAKMQKENNTDGLVRGTTGGALQAEPEERDKWDRIAERRRMRNS